MQEQFAAEQHKQPVTAKSPLRYPGGKTRGVDVICSFFPAGINAMVSPFFGGGSVELQAAAKGIKVHGYDVFTPLVEFWQCLARDAGALADEVQKYFPLSKQTFYQLQKTQTLSKSRLRRAAVYYVLNRSSFSGATLSGGMSPQHPRFTQSSIDRLRSFYNPNFSVHQADFKESLRKHDHLFAYLDPPYLIKSTLYGRKGDAHKDFDHEGLASILHDRKNWLLSYNDCAEIRSWYSGFRIVVPNWKYGMSNIKTSREVLIFSHDLK